MLGAVESGEEESRDSDLGEFWIQTSKVPWQSRWQFVASEERAKYTRLMEATGKLSEKKLLIDSYTEMSG